MKAIILKALPSDGTFRPRFIGQGYQATPMPISAEYPVSHLDLQYIDEYGDLCRARLDRDITEHPFNPDFAGYTNDGALKISAYIRTEEWTDQKIMLIRIAPEC